jgi:hypothetical protein
VVVGTSDELKAEFLSLISQKTWHVDGVSGHFRSIDGVSLDIWFPKEDASSKILVSFSFRGVNGALIVMGRKDRRILRRFVKQIRNDSGSIPFVGVVLRKSMTEVEKGVKSLHAVKLLSDKMKAVSSETEQGASIELKPLTPEYVAGKSTYTVDEFGFIVMDSLGIPLFSSEEEEEIQKKSKKSYE